MLTRRSFLSLAALSACAGAKPPASPRDPVGAGAIGATAGDAAARALEHMLGAALDEAKRGGASYADARVHTRRYERVATREDHVIATESSESYGIGVRVIAGGAWGFAATAVVDEASARAAAREALALARAHEGARKRPLALAPTKAYRASWSTPLEIDPFTVSLADKAALLLSVWPEASKVSGVAFATASSEIAGEDKIFASSEGSLITQRITRVQAGYELTARDAKTGDFVTRAHELPPMQAGWEHVAKSSLARDARRLGEEVVEKLRAPRLEARKRDLILAPSNLWLTIHESVGHPTELDRALGYEANFAGTSFATPDKLGKLRYASEGVTLYADKTTPGGLATVGYDDDGVPTQRWDIVKDGLFVGYQTTREQAAWIGERESRGTSYAESFASVPFQRMPNLSLAPDPKGGALADIVSATDDGVLVLGQGSWSIDHQRYNFQFGGQLFYEVKHGKATRMVKDVAYQSSSLDFWRSCDMIGGPESWELHGALHDGKGEPGQSNPVSHGCPPARFRGVSILDTGRSKA